MSEHADNTTDRDLPDGPSSEQTERMGRVVMDRITAEEAKRRRRRTGIWTGAAAAVAVVAVAALISPAVTGSVSASSGSSVSAPDVVMGADMPMSTLGEAELGEVSPEMVDGSTASEFAGAADAARTDVLDGRDVIANGSVMLTVDNQRDTANALADLATAQGGYVESVSLSETPSSTMQDGVEMYPVGGYSWVTIRVPSDSLDETISAVGELGEVTQSSVDRSDVTSQAVDLRARVAAQEASVQRLTELLAESASVADLIAAESALADRQAALDADRQQLKMLEESVAMSSLTISLTTTPTTISADPASFWDGLLNGWNGLVATLNGTIVGLGFLLPWLVAGGVVFVIVWAVRRGIRGRRERRANNDSTPE